MVASTPERNLAAFFVTGASEPPPILAKFPRSGRIGQADTDLRAILAFVPTRWESGQAAHA